MPQDLFDTSENSELLRINRSKKIPVSKEQAEFNRLVKKIEKLNNEILQHRSTLEQKLIYAMHELRPISDKIALLKMDLVHQLDNHLKISKISKKKASSVKEIIADLISEIFTSDATVSKEQHDALDKIMEKHFPDYSAEPKKNEEERLKMQKTMVEEFMWSLGIDVDLSWLTNDMSDAEIEENLKQRLDDINLGQKKSTRKKSKKQLERETQLKAAEKLKDRGLKEIYVQLVKLVHPDRETDDQIRLEKEEWMKKITTAYKNKDLKKLLEIELVLFKHEQKDLSTKSTTQIKLYIALLKEQVKGLEEQKYNVGLEPRFRPLSEYSDNPFELIHWLPEQKKSDLLSQVEAIEADLLSLKKKGRSANLVVNSLVEIWEQEYHNPLDDQLFDDLFDDMFDDAE